MRDFLLLEIRVILRSGACGGQAASQSHGRSKRDTARQRHVWPQEVMEGGGRTHILRRYGGFQDIPVTGSPATCVKSAAAHVSIRDLPGAASRQASHTATTNEVSDVHKHRGHILLEGLIGRSIDVRQVEQEQVDASTGGASMCPIDPPSVSHRPCSNRESLS